MSVIALRSSPYQIIEYRKTLFTSRQLVLIKMCLICVITEAANKPVAASEMLDAA